MVRLTIHKPDRGTEVHDYEEQAEVTVGRSQGCTVCLDYDPMVSRMHAVLLIDPPSVRVKDLNSTNGITINGENFGALSIQKIFNPLELRDGDEVLIGHTRFIVNMIDKDDLKPVAVPIENSTRVSIKSSFLSADDRERDNGAEETISGPSSVMPVVPGYRLSRILSLGSTGTVYLAYSNVDGRNVAIKILSPDIPFARKTIEEFRRVIDQARNVVHPNLVRLIGAGEIDGEGGSMYLVMEHVNGEDLSNYLRRKPGNRIALHNAYNLMLQLSSAICYIHRHGFLHMDIKPRSIILFDDNGRLRAKITDQGFARFLDETGILPRGYHGNDAQRLACLSPEELDSANEAKPTADVFSLCAVFYEILTGKPPYNFVEGEDNRGIVERGEIVPIEERMPGLPEPLVVIVERGLSLDPEMRYQSGCDLLDALENVWV